MRNQPRGISALILTLALGAGCEGLGPDDEALDGIEVVHSALTSGATKINCGGPTIGSFVADVDFSTPTETIAPRTGQIKTGEYVVNPGPAAVYETGRYHQGSFNYTLPGFAKDSTNLIRLHFSESHWTTVGQRSFNVSINGTPVLTNFDIVVAAGGPNLRVVREFTMQPDDKGQYVVAFTTNKDAAFINAIEVIPVTTPTTPPATRIRAGGAALGAFSSDTGFSGTTSTIMRDNVINTTGVLHAAPSDLYKTQRFGDDFTYTITAPPNSINTVRLHFCDTKNAAAGLRSFNVDINDVRRIDHLDLAATAGQNKAVVRELSLPADASGAYRIRFTKNIDKALISGIEVLNTVPWFMRRNMTAAEAQTEFDARVTNGYRVTALDGYTVNGATRFVEVFDLTPGPAFASRVDIAPGSLQAELDAKKAAGFSLTLLNGYAVGTAEKYAAVWEVKSPAPTQVVKFGMTSSQYQTEFNTQLAAGMRLQHVSGYNVNGQHRFAAHWAPRPGGPAWAARHMMTLADFETEIKNHTAANDRLVDVSSYNVGGTDFYTAIFEASPGQASVWERGVDSTTFGKEADDLYRQGFRPTMLAAAAPASGTERWTGIWENPYWSKADLTTIDTQLEALQAVGSIASVRVPSASIAITTNGRLVFARARGVAKKGSTPATDTPAHASSLYRIGSTSKAIAAAGMMKTIEQGKANLSSKVFDANSITGLTYGTPPYFAEIPKINVKEMLDHTSGWIFKDTIIPSLIGQPPKYAIDWSLDHYPVTNTAAGQFSYSNAGYMVVARLVETVTNPNPTQPIPDGWYESWMKANVLAPMGITDMRIGSDTSLFPDEVTPYNDGSFDPMGDPIKEMAGGGGWIATAIDLARFMVRMDRSPTVPDFLSPESLTSAFTGSTVNAGYGFGWILDGDGVWHDGLMGGSCSAMRIRTNGRTFAATVNMQVDTSKLESKVKTLVDSSGLSYPIVDLFTPMDQL